MHTIRGVVEELVLEQEATRVVLKFKFAVFLRTLEKEERNEDILGLGYVGWWWWWFSVGVVTSKECVRL